MCSQKLLPVLKHWTGPLFSWQKSWLSSHLVLLLFSLVRQLDLLFHSPKSPTSCLWLLCWHKCLYFLKHMGFVRRRGILGNESDMEILCCCCCNIYPEKLLASTNHLSSIEIHTNLHLQRSYLPASWKWHGISWCLSMQQLGKWSELVARKQFKENPAILIDHLIAHLICASHIYRKLLFLFLLKALV